VKQIMTTFPELVAKELARARTLHQAPLSSAHEAAAVIREEHEEFWDEVKRKDRNNLELLKELIHLAAMCQRTAEDVLGLPVETEG
jgi:purine nucleoside phosphorylase